MAFDIAPYSGAIEAVSNLGSKIIDKVIPDPMQQAQAKALLASSDFAPLLEQIKINLVEAASPSIFVSGWRPFVGWVCGGAFAYTFILQPFLVLLIAQWVPHIADRLPTLDWTTLGAVLFGMLGLSRDRRIEKINGVASK